MPSGRCISRFWTTALTEKLLDKQEQPHGLPSYRNDLSLFLPFLPSLETARLFDYLRELSWHCWNKGVAFQSSVIQIIFYSTDLLDKSSFTMLFVWLHILLPALLSLFYPTDNDLFNKVSFITDHPEKNEKKTFISLAFFILLQTLHQVVRRETALPLVGSPKRVSWSQN